MTPVQTHRSSSHEGHADELGESVRSRVLFVDDEPRLLEGVRTALRKETFDILTAGSAAEGLKILADDRIDVVVSDERMPGMSGSEFLSVVRQRYPATIRIILTGEATLDAAVRAINQGGIYRFLTKPCNPLQLAHTIKDALLLKSLSLESSRLLETVRRQRGVLEELEAQHPGIGRLDLAEDGRILIEAPSDVESLIDEIRGETNPSARTVRDR